MNLITRNFRRWWQTPRSIDKRPENRKVSYLELFYDLVYVVVIAELSHSFLDHGSINGLLQFLFLFSIVWWAWLNGCIYHDLHSNLDLRTRVFTFIQMFAIVAMATSVHDAFGDKSTSFALSYAMFQLIMAYLWWRTGVHDKNHRPLSQPFSLMLLINIALLIGSVFITSPIKFYLWGLVLLQSVVLPFILFNSNRKGENIQQQIALGLQTRDSQIERFGLFTIIALGEVIVAVVSGVTSSHEPTIKTIIIAGMGIFIAIGMWSLYFDIVSRQIPKEKHMLSWSFLHLPLTGSIATCGAAVLNIIKQDTKSLPSMNHNLLIGSVMVFLLCLVCLMFTFKRSKHLFRSGQIIIAGVALSVSLLGFFPLKSIVLMLALSVLLLIPIFCGFLFWLKGMNKTTSDSDIINTS